MTDMTSRPLKSPPSCWLLQLLGSPAQDVETEGKAAMMTGTVGHNAPVWTMYLLLLF